MISWRWVGILVALAAGTYGVKKGYISIHLPPFASAWQFINSTPLPSHPAAADRAELQDLPARPLPPGYFCLLERASVATDSGVVGIPAGTKLALLARNQGKLRLSDGQVDLWVPETAVTADLNIGELAQRSDARSQAQIRTVLAEHKALAEKKEAEHLERLRTAAEQLLKLQMARPISAATPATSVNPLERGAYNQTYNRPWHPYYGRSYYDRWGNRYYMDSSGRWVY